MSRSSLVTWSAVVALLVGLAGSEASASPTRAAAGVGHFACYSARLTGGKHPIVSLRNQFGTTKGVIGNPLQLCSPASKNGGPVPNPKAHLVCFTLGHVATNAKFHRVEMFNQFGSLQMAVVTNPPFSLCAPSSKRKGTGVPPPIPTTLDYYLCYSVDPTSPFHPLTVTVDDQFGKSLDDVVVARTLCLPTSKNGAPIRNRGVHLLCYRLDSHTRGAPVVARTQFGVLTGSAVARQALCVPSKKHVLS